MIDVGSWEIPEFLWNLVKFGEIKKKVPQNPQSDIFSWWQMKAMCLSISFLVSKSVLRLYFWMWSQKCAKKKALTPNIPNFFNFDYFFLKLDWFWIVVTRRFPWCFWLVMKVKIAKVVGKNLKNGLFWQSKKQGGRYTVKARSRGEISKLTRAGWAKTGLGTESKVVEVLTG